MIQSIDFLPTLAEAAGASLPPERRIDGRSFAAVLRGQATAHRDRIFTFFPHNTPASGQLPACAVSEHAAEAHCGPTVSNPRAQPACG